MCGCGLSERRVRRPGWRQLWAGEAEDVLAERYARSEIDDDEYRRRMTLLREYQ